MEKEDVTAVHIGSGLRWDTIEFRGGYVLVNYKNEKTRGAVVI